MEGHLLNAYLAPVLVPCIMSLAAYRHTAAGHTSSALYATSTLGTILATLNTLGQFHLNRNTRSRRKLALFMATLATVCFVSALVAFHWLRGLTLVDYTISPEMSHYKETNQLLSYHFYADILPALAIFLAAQLCSLINHELMCRGKRHFVLGESMIVAQLSSTSFLVWALSTYSTLFHGVGLGPFQVTLFTSIVLNLGLLVFLLLVLPSYLLMSTPTNKAARAARNTGLKYTLLGLTLSSCYLVAQKLIGPSLDPATWLVAQIFESQQRISLFCLWLSTVTGCLSFSATWTRMVGQTNSLARKIFHLAACVIFMSGYNQDLEFTRFAVGGVLVTMLLLEVVRGWKLEPFGAHLENMCQALRGKWDNQYLTLSHIYLLTGVFIPLWILPPDQGQTDKLILSSGIISLGVGDTAAAVVGIFFGKRKLRNTSKTLEGLTGNIIAMFVFKIIWVGFDTIPREFAFAFACILTATAETIITTCDNLILPLVMIFMFQIL